METSRLNRVKQYLELSLDEAKDLEDLVFLTSEICETPIASITFVDDKNQYPVVYKGNAIETSCDIAFCNHTIKQENILEITDAETDPRFSNNPLVTGDPHIRFYAGAPLITSDGFTIGSLCAIDQQPKKLTQSQVKSLQILTKQVMRRLELHLNMQLLKESLDEAEQNKELLENAAVMKEAFYDNCDDYFLLLNSNLQIVNFNQSAVNFFNERNFKADLQVGKRVFEYIQPSLIERFAEIFETVKNGDIIQHEILVNADSENNFWIKISLSPSYNSKKELIGIACIGCNIQKEKTQEEKINIQKSVLAQIADIHAHEIRHPLTNILAVIDLIKHEDFKMTKQYIEFLETASNELDQVIRKVVLNSYEAT